MTRIGVIETGRPPDYLQPKFGTYPGMFSDLLSAEGDMEFSAHSVLDPLLSATDRDAWIITGSSAGVYENLPWILPLMDFINDSAKLSIPTLGICFGHQIMAQAYGGTVQKFDKGRGIGVQSYSFTERGQQFFGGIQNVNLNAAHQDQIVRPPENAEILVTSEFCPYAGLAYGNYGLSFQPHPEFSNDYEGAIITHWQELDPAPPSVYNAAMETLKRIKPDSRKLAPAMAKFLTGSSAV